MPFDEWNKTLQVEEPEFVRRISDPNAPFITNPDGSVSTHLMMSGEDKEGHYAFPTIVNRGGKLVKLSPEEAHKYAQRTGELKRFSTQAEAKAYAKGSWKKQVGETEGFGAWNESLGATAVAEKPLDPNKAFEQAGKTWDMSAKSEVPLTDFQDVQSIIDEKLIDDDLFIETTRPNILMRPGMAFGEAVWPGIRKKMLAWSLRDISDLQDTRDFYAEHWDKEIRNAPWYKKLPEVVGYIPEKIIEFQVLSGLFKALGLSSLFNTLGTKLSSKIAGKQLAAIGGKQALLKYGGWNTFRIKVLSSVAKTAPENMTFLSTWFSTEAARRGEPIGPAARKGALWGLGFSLAIPLVAEGWKAGISTKTFEKISLKIQAKHPKLADFLAGKPEQEFIDATLKSLKEDAIEAGEIMPEGIVFSKLAPQTQSLIKGLARQYKRTWVKLLQRDSAAKKYWAAGVPEVKKVAAKVTPTTKGAIVTPEPTPTIAEKPPTVAPVEPKAVEPSKVAKPTPEEMTMAEALAAASKGERLPVEVAAKYKITQPEPRPAEVKKGEEWYENRWDSAKLGRRVDLAMKAKWITKKGKLTKLGEKIAQTKWVDLSPAAQNVLRSKLDELYERKPIVRIEDKPSIQATAYKEPKIVEEETAKEIEQIKVAAQTRPGFARIPSVAEFQELSTKLKESIAKINKPERDIVTSAYGAVEKWRAETNKAGLFADWSKETLKKIKATPKQLKIVDRYLDNPKAYQADYDDLPDEVKEMGKALKADYDEMHKIAKQEGIIESWIENYTPHLYTDSEIRLKRTLYPQGGKLGTKFRFGKQRKIKTLDEAEKLGLHPVDDPILKNAVYKYQLYRTIANRNLIELLKRLKREDGMPLIMGRPKKADKLAVWESEYEWVNVPGLQRFMYVGEVTEMPMLVKMSAKADPEVAKMLNNVFAPWSPQGKAIKGYKLLRGKVKRLIMMNPLIHGTNIFSDVLDEMNFRPIATLGRMKRGGELYRQKDEIVERAVNAGLELKAGFGVSRDLRKYMLESSETMRGIWGPISKLEQASDKILWNKIVRNSQIGLFETLTERIAQEQPTWTQDKIDRTAAYYINTLLGTIPHTWFSKWGRDWASVALFARNWTVSNIDMVVKASTMGKVGMGMRAIPRDEQYRTGKNFAKHLAKGVFGLLAFTNLLQLGFLTITNELKKRGIIKGKQVPLHTSFQNESWKHWLDVDTGLDTKTGQRIYLVAPLFRYMRDYFGWATQPLKTLYNKWEPIFKNSIEQIINYSVWQHKQIAQRGAPKLDQIKQRALYFVKGLTPSQFYAHKPGKVPTTFEWLIPYTGTWIRRGAPGGKFTRLLWDFQAEQGYEKSKLDEDIDELLQRGKWEQAFMLMAENERYKTADGAAGRIVRMVTPLNYYMDIMSDTEKAKYLKWLQDKGYSIDDLTEEMKAELTEVAERDN